MKIFIANRQRAKKINTRLLKQIVSELFTEMEITEAELGINLVSSREMTLINETFLKHEGSTDVITFDHVEQRKTNRGKLTQLHGELFVCVDVAMVQAKEFKTSWQTEVVRYVVHGFLHLLGYDDLEPALRRRMKREENRLVRLLAKRFALAQLSPEARISA